MSAPVRALWRLVLALAALLAVPYAPALAQGPSSPPPTLIIYDSSNSMWGELGEGGPRKYEAARKAVREFAEQTSQERPVGLRLYGHRRKDDCRDSSLVVPFATANAERIRSATENVRPTGQTPIHYSLEQALADFGDRTGDILLVTDGIESCDADPCALLSEWRERGIRIRVHIVGLGLSEREKAAMQCLSDAAGTVFRDARSAAELRDSLSAAIESTSPPAPVDETPAPTPDLTPGEFGFHVESDRADGHRVNGIPIAVLVGIRSVV